MNGLDRDKFVLRVNGKEQPVAFFERVVAGSNKEFAPLTSNRNRPTPATENEQPAGSAAIERGRISLSEASQKPTIRPDARFTKAAKLRFQTYVYNAATANVTMQVELRRNGQVVTQTPPSAVPTEGVKDLSHIPVVGEFPLQGFPPGEYQLSIAVTNQSTKKSASQQVTFIVQ